MRVLILSTTTGYQLRAFDEAAKRLGYALTFATDRCKMLEDPWQDHAVPVKFYEADQAASLAEIERAAREAPIDGVIAVGDRPVVLAALAAERLGLRGNPPAAARVSTSKLLTRAALDRAGLPVPWFFRLRLDASMDSAVERARFPCVVKPLALAGGRGVVRADDEPSLRAALARVRSLLERRDVRAQRNPDHGFVLIEGYIAGDEYAVEGLVRDGDFVPLALFDKPDPLIGPFFEETIYLTPSRVATATQQRIVHTIAAACRAIGLRHGPIHAEVRLNESGVFVLEVAARPIGGLCARALRFVSRGGGENDPPISLEDLLMQHATGAPVADLTREPQASGVMMIPIPRRGHLRGVSGLVEARRVPGVQDVVITAKLGQMLVPLPEGAGYPGFIFARGDTADQVESSLRAAHATLGWDIERPLDVLPSIT